MEDLASKRCVPCRGGVPPLSPDEVARLLEKLPAGWESRADRRIAKAFEFPDFAAALEFTQRAGQVAEEQGHHPDLHLSWGRVVVEIWTHKIDGLTESDFILAARIEGQRPS